MSTHNHALVAASEDADGIRGIAKSPDRSGVYGRSTSWLGYAVSAENTASYTEAYLAGRYGAKISNTRSECTLAHDSGGVWARNLVANTLAMLAGYTEAGLFIGTVRVYGDLVVSKSITAATKNFRIDHPLDPSNKTLEHAAVESAEMLVVHSGNAVLGADGTADVPLPEYFEAMNRDVRYQLTCVGGYAPVYVAEEVHDNRFRIAGGTPGMKVSWQLTGKRNDAWAKSNPLVPEKEKSAAQRGTYLHPEAFGAPQTGGTP